MDFVVVVAEVILAGWIVVEGVIVSEHRLLVETGAQADVLVQGVVHRHRRHRRAVIQGRDDLGEDIGPVLARIAQEAVAL